MPGTSRRVWTREGACAWIDTWWWTATAYDEAGVGRIFALGDCAAVEGSEAPPTAQAASEQANHLARELPRYCAGQAPRAFEYRHKGTLMSLGAAGAVGRLRSGLGHDLQIRGRVAAAAYRGLERQHEMVVLGRVRGSARMFKELFSPQRGPRVKVH